MISKLAKAKDNWFFKILSAAVAVSFISLFGVTGYIGSASQNQTVVKVGNKKITQSEFSYRQQKEINALRNLTGDDFDLTDEMRANITESILKQVIDDSIIDETMAKYNIHFPKAFVQQVIFSRPEFMNPLTGQFNPDIFKRYLSSAGLSENEYVAMIERAMARKFLITDLVGVFNVPQVLKAAIHKMDNQRKQFKYTVISPKDIKIERQITEDEIAQYYSDFADNFTVPEVRTAEVLYLPNDIILHKYAADDETVKEYFNTHKKELDTPEKREVLQMVFLNKEAAEKALSELEGGKGFNETATDNKAENASEPTLGLVSADELAEDLSTAAFDMALNETRLLEVADTWQIIRITQILPAKEAVFEDVKAEIVENLANENMYDATRAAKADIDDMINSGKSLAETAEALNAFRFTISNIQEESLVKGLPEYAAELGDNLDFNELVFSYGLDEPTAAEEFDNGVAVIRVTEIKDAHLPEISDIKEDIINLWKVQEKDALAKETADNIVADVEDGGEIAKAAAARDFEAYSSQPISRNESFANLTPAEITELFLANDGEVKMFEHAGNTFIIATPFKTVNYTDTLTEDNAQAINLRAMSSILTDMSSAALENYGKDFKVKVDYQLIGLTD